MTSRQKGFLKTFVKLAVSGTAMYFVFRAIDWPQTKAILYAASRPLLLLATLLFVMSKVVSAFRLQVYFRNISLQISHRHNLMLAWLGMFYNLFLPGGVGGDGYKVFLLRNESGLSTKLIGAAVLIDRISGVVALGFLACLGACFLTVSNLPPWLPWLGGAGAVVAFPALYLLKVWLFPSFVAQFGVTSAYSLVTQGLQLICAFCLLLSLGLEAQYLEYLVLFLVSSVVAVLPFTIGGVGARELTFILSYAYLGVDKNLAVAFSLLFFLITLFVSMFGFLADVGKRKS